MIGPCGQFTKSFLSEVDNRMGIKLIVVDEQEVMRSGLKSLVSRSSISVVAEAKASREAIRLVQKHKPDVVMLDVQLKGTEGFETLSRIKKKWPDMPVVMWSSLDNPTYVARSNALGAAGYLPRSAGRRQLLATIRSAAAGKNAWLPEHYEQIVDEMELPEDLDVPLTPREFDVLRQLSFGLSNKEIAQALHISYETVKEHIQHILRKLDCTDRTQAAVWAVRQGLV